MKIHRLIDEPFISNEYINRIEKDSVSSFNHYLQHVRDSEQEMKAEEFLDLVIYDVEKKGDWGLHTMMKYNIFFTTDDLYEFEMMPEEKLTKYVRKHSLKKYIESLDPYEVELKVLIFICEKCLNLPDIENQLKNKNNKKQEIIKRIKDNKDAHDEIEQYLKTNCLDHLLFIKNRLYI